jgi:hypothetical protein
VSTKSVGQFLRFAACESGTQQAGAIKPSVVGSGAAVAPILSVKLSAFAPLPHVGIEPPQAQD